MDFSDIASQYLSNRFDQATKPFSDPEGYMEDRFGNVKPKSTTINYNDDGSKSITTKHEVAAPVAPEEIKQPEPMPQAAPAPVATPTPAPIPQPQAMPQAVAQAPVAPQAQMTPAVYNPGQGGNPNLAPNGTWNDFQDQSQLPPEARMPQPGAEPAPAPVAPVAPQAQMTPAVAQAPTPVQPAPQPNVAPAPVEQPAQKADWQTALENAKGDERKYAAIISNDAYPEDIRKLASERMYKEAQLKQDGAKVEKILKGVAEGDPKATNDLVRYQKSQKEEGSLLKAVMYARLGLNDLAHEEQGKLSGGAIENLALGNKYYTVVRGKNGIQQAFDSEGKTVDDSTLAKINAEAFATKGATTGQTMGKDKNGNVISHTILPNGRGVVWKNETTGETLSGAPEGYHSMGSKTAEEIADIKGIGTAAQIETKMRKANADAVALGLPVPYSEQMIASEKAKVSKVAQGTPYAGAPTPAGSASANLEVLPNGARVTPEQKKLADQGIPIISGFRSQAENNALKHHQINGQWFTKEGNPVSESTTHAEGNSIDVDSKKLTKEGRQTLAREGWYQPIPQQDPNHWERMPSAGATSVPAASSPAVSNAPRAGTTSSIAEKIANYEMKPPASRSAQYGPLMQEVARINPDYDETKYATVQQARKNFTTGKQGDTVRSMNVAIDHLDTLKDAGNALQNGNLPLFNKITNEFAKNTGSPVVTDFNGIKSIVGSEVAKAVAGGNMALADREEIRKELDAANSPQQLAGVIKRMQQLLGGQLKGLKTQYEDAGLRDFDKKLTPRTKQVLGGIGEEKKNTNNTRSNW